MSLWQVNNHDSHGLGGRRGRRGKRDFAIKGVERERGGGGDRERERERERGGERENSKTLFYKDSSLGLVKNVSIN